MSIPLGILQLAPHLLGVGKVYVAHGQTHLHDEYDGDFYDDYYCSYGDFYDDYHDFYGDFYVFFMIMNGAKW